MKEKEIELLASKIADLIEERQRKAVIEYIDLLWNAPIKSQEDIIKEFKENGINIFRESLEPPEE